RPPPGGCAHRIRDSLTPASVAPEYHRAGRHAYTAADQHMIDGFRRVGGGAANQPRGSRDVVHAVAVALGEQAAMGVVGQTPVNVERAASHHVLALALAAEAEALQLHEDLAGECVV